MAAAAIFSSLRRRRSPTLEAFLAPIHLSDSALVKSLLLVSNELVSTFSHRSPPFQRRNFRTLIRKIEIFAVIFEFLATEMSNGFQLPSSAIVCFKELHIFLYRSKILLDYCFLSSRLWLLLQNSLISSHFHDLKQEVSTFFDICPLEAFELCDDVREQIELLKKQANSAKFFIDHSDETFRRRLFGFLDEFGEGVVPDPMELRAFFVERLGIQDAKSCASEIEFLEELICNYGEDVEPSLPVLNGVVALLRYCKFLIFGFDKAEEIMGLGNEKKLRKSVISQEIAETFVTIPKDFCCPISLELMRDPVIVSTGQTYDRISIVQWMEEGNYSCPKTGQALDNSRLVPNKALQSLISRWCIAHGIPFDPPECADACKETVPVALPTSVVIEANRATVKLLVEQLSRGSQSVKACAAHELRLLAKTGKENRAYIAEAGAIPLLHKLLSSPNPVAQENSVTAILNLSIYDNNKSRIMEEIGCLKSIVQVLRFGHTREAKENAAATLFSLSAVHDYKTKITNEEGTIDALAGLLKEGTLRGKKDAITALFNLSTHVDNCSRMIESGAVRALVEALETEGVVEEAAGALALLVRQPLGAEAVRNEEMAVPRLIETMRRGTPKGKENAVAALLELCRSGGSVTTEKVVRVSIFPGLLQNLMFTGTKRARRKALSLAKVCHRCDAASLPYGWWGVEYTFARNSAANLGSSFASDVSASIAISVPVL
ncbi:U-box domain-containing protein 17-like [Malania oleifera]|uniref:U-box domain-containing protein 17-like n=1 Tax=Malania oleifera TaxID=397392 RepID=UPI0025AE5B1E|nr:U-box domain-containing protein 17-like [Malania oleifera]